MADLYASRCSPRDIYCKVNTGIHCKVALDIGKMSDRCISCRQFVAKDIGILCSSCNGVYHTSCLNLLPDDLKYIREHYKNNWKCDVCIKPGRKHRSGSVTGASASQSSMAANSGVREDEVSTNPTFSSAQFSALMAEFASMRALQQSIISDIGLIRDEQQKMRSDFKIQYDLLNSDMQEHQMILDSHTESIAKISGKIDALEKGMTVNGGSPHNRDNPSLDDMIGELQERSKRRSNIVIFGLPESSDNNKRDSERLDKASVEEILSVVDNSIDFSAVIKISRVGRLHANRCRPLKVVLQSEALVHSVIKRAPKVKEVEKFAGVNISYDRTAQQQDSYRRLREEMNARIGAGETNLKIRYIRDVPRIISLNN